MRIINDLQKSSLLMDVKINRRWQRELNLNNGMHVAMGGWRERERGREKEISGAMNKKREKFNR